jgi:hypothetical protein
MGLPARMEWGNHEVPTATVTATPDPLRSVKARLHLLQAGRFRLSARWGVLSDIIVFHHGTGSRGGWISLFKAQGERVRG